MSLASKAYSSKLTVPTEDYPTNTNKSECLFGCLWFNHVLMAELALRSD